AAGSALVYSAALYNCNNMQDTLAVTGRVQAIDSAGNVYLAGSASNTCPPAIVNATQPDYGGGRSDAYVAKVNATGTAVLFGTYLGGSGDDEAGSLALDSSGNVYVAGSTPSTDFPTVHPIQATYGGGSSDAFVAKIAVGPASTVTLTPYSVSFGNQDVNTTSSENTITLSNRGSTALSITSISITGTNSD